MALPRLLQMPRFVRFCIRIDTAPEWLWLALLAAALWPTWWWMGQRMGDGSDDPLGLLALAALGVVVWQHRRVLRPAPRLGWLALALAGALAATAARAHLPPLAGALMALLALAAGLVAFLPPHVATAPVLGLSVLSLPLLASLQFYAGYPLRVVTAEASRWLLALQHDVARSGSSLLVDGHLIIVDAPCSGVQMVWLGYFTACVVALYGASNPASGGRNRTFLLRLPVVSVLVLTGNVLRNTVLVAAQAAGWHWPGWAHDAVGLVVQAAVCGGIGWVMGRHTGNRNAGGSMRPFDNLFLNRVLYQALWAVLLPLCALWGVAQTLAVSGSDGAPDAAAPVSAELPAAWNGAALRPLALSEVEHRFARRFPGTLARLTDGQQVLVLRTVRQPTRMLHPAADCYKGLGYRISDEKLEAIAGQAKWRCFIAERAGRHLRVCERIEDAQGQTFTDASAWYWAALAGQSSGPWQAITVARPL